ncbi:MAG: hypothetical protein WC369_01510 [Dehalococcoidales bacterium]|jgi:antitoxin component YwqK of YwqJK toxin-antitoxin module
MKDYDGLVTLRGHEESVLAQGYFSKGIPYGLWNFWHANGQLAKQYNLPEKRHSEPNPYGLIRERYMDGKMLLEGHYSDGWGNMIGTWKGWDESGEISLRDGKRFESGTIGAVFFKDIGPVVFGDGSPYGKWPTYSEDGYVRCMILLPEGKKAYFEGYYKNSLRQGWWKLWMYDGRIISLTYYIDGLPNGFIFIINPWLLRSMNYEFRGFIKHIKYCPYAVYFKGGMVVTKEEYEQNI